MKKSKKVKKKKSDDLDEITKKLLEQEIERPELEQYEKIDVDFKKKPVPEEPEAEVTLKPNKEEPIEEVQEQITLKKKKSKPKVVEEEEVEQAITLKKKVSFIKQKQDVYI